MLQGTLPENNRKANIASSRKIAASSAIQLRCRSSVGTVRRYAGLMTNEEACFHTHRRSRGCRNARGVNIRNLNIANAGNNGTCRKYQTMRLTGPAPRERYSPSLGVPKWRGL